MTCPIHDDTLKKLTTRAYEYLQSNPKWVNQRNLRKVVGGTFEYYPHVMDGLAELPRIQTRKVLVSGKVSVEVKYNPPLENKSRAVCNAK